MGALIALALAAIPVVAITFGIGTETLTARKVISIERVIPIAIETANRF
jgi:hypothetical protein